MRSPKSTHPEAHLRQLRSTNLPLPFSPSSTIKKKEEISKKENHLELTICVCIVPRREDAKVRMEREG